MSAFTRRVIKVIRNIGTFVENLNGSRIRHMRTDIGDDLETKEQGGQAGQ